MKREVKKKPAKPKQETKSVENGGNEKDSAVAAASTKTDESGSISDDSVAIKSDILSLAERLAQKKGQPIQKLFLNKEICTLNIVSMMARVFKIIDFIGFFYSNL